MHTQTKFVTTAAYLSGGICGALWWPVGHTCGKPFRLDLRGPFGVMDRFTEPATFADALNHVLMREGGDFQNAQFTADTVIRIERRRQDAPGRYSVHVREIEVANIDPDLVNDSAYTSDFFGEED